MLALALAVMPASPQNTWPPNAWPPIQVAQPDEKVAPAAEQTVVLPELGWPDAIVIGVAAVVGLGLLTLTHATRCNDSGDCGGPAPVTTSTGTR